MTKLNQLTDENFSRKKRMRVGRGIGSGKGKTCGSGHKGQKSRSGVSIYGFEGGQMPIYRRVPKRGFKSLNKVEYVLLNTGDIQKLIDSKRIDAKKEISIDTLTEAGLAKKTDLLKILAKGAVSAAVTIKAHAASKTAVAAIEKAGGKLAIN